MLEINISLESLILWKVFETPYHGLSCGLAQNVGMIFTILLNASIFCVIRKKSQLTRDHCGCFSNLYTDNSVVGWKQWSAPQF